MKTWILLITFFISITGLLFKTTEEGKGKIKKINQWGILLMSFMIILLLFNIYLDRIENEKEKANLANQIKQDSLKRFIEDSRSQQVINRLKDDSSKNSQIIELQNRLVKESEQSNIFLKEKFNSARDESLALLFPIDSSMYLTFKARLRPVKSKSGYYHDMLKSNALVQATTGTVNLRQNQNSLFNEVSTLKFEVEFRNKDDSLVFIFPASGLNAYITYQYDDCNTLYSYWHPVKCNGFTQKNFHSLNQACKSRCFVKMLVPSQDNALFDFEVDIDYLEISNRRGDRHIKFSHFEPLHETVDPFWLTEYLVMHARSKLCVKCDYNY